VAPTAAVDFGEGGDRILNLGSVPIHGSTVFFLSPSVLADFDVDMIVLMRTQSTQAPQIVLAGMQSVFSKLGRQTRWAPSRRLIEWFFPTAEAAGQDGLVRRGRRIFFEETFSGNGRTCGTCHPEPKFILDPASIQELFDDEPFNPLFVSQNFPDLLPPGLFEDPPRMFAFSHILENVDGFDEVCEFPGTDVNPDTPCISLEDVVCTDAACEHPLSKSVRRAIPTTVNTDLTDPFGLGGDIVDLQAFCLGAVVQHFPISLNRIVDVDFRLPTVRELEAMAAFMQSVLLPKNVNKEFDPFAVVRTAAEIRGAALFQAGVAGPPIRGSAGRCLACHFPPTLSARVNLDTGVNALAFSRALPFDDGGANTGGVCGSDSVLKQRRIGC
jgi:hypothetical protein